MLFSDLAKDVVFQFELDHRQQPVMNDKTYKVIESKINSKTIQNIDDLKEIHTIKNGILHFTWRFTVTQIKNKK